VYKSGEYKETELNCTETPVQLRCTDCTKCSFQFILVCFSFALYALLRDVLCRSDDVAEVYESVNMPLIRSGETQMNSK